MVAFMADRKASSKTAGTVKKVTSSPNIRGLAESENGDISPADKKRNKLGYHRTAVACGHCRRRKIRCIPSADTSSTRCQNCIRLKKDCQFYPVDQSTTTQPKRNRSESKGDALAAESETSVSSSSPRIHAVAPAVDPFDHFRPPIETASISQGVDHEYPQHAYDQRHWFQPEPQQHPYWLQHEQHHTNSFTPSPYPITPTTGGPIAHHEHAYTYPSISMEHSSYPYPTQRSRDGPLPTQSGPMPAFGGYRANTMPDRIGLSDDIQRSHEMHPQSMTVPAPHLMGPPFQPLHGSPTHYAQPAPHQIWIPAHSESQNHSNNYISSGPAPSWYSHPDGMGDARDGDASHSHPRESVSQDPNLFRTKPG